MNLILGGSPNLGGMPGAGAGAGAGGAGAGAGAGAHGGNPPGTIRVT